MVIGSTFFRNRSLTSRRKSTNVNSRRRRWPMSSSKMSCKRLKVADLCGYLKSSFGLLWMVRGYQVKSRFIKTVYGTSHRSAPRRLVRASLCGADVGCLQCDIIDILFSNIKHLFFQPCDHELLVIMHIHLKAPIMIGKKKAHVSPPTFVPRVS